MPARGWRTIIVGLLAAGVTLPALAGCHLFRKKRKIPQSDPIPPATQVADEQLLRTPPAVDRPVKVGVLPLVYLLEHPGEVRVVNATTNRVLLTTMVGGRTILALDPDDGITIGGRRVLPGRLDPAHQYEVYLNDPTPENINRNVYERR